MWQPRPFSEFLADGAAPIHIHISNELRITQSFTTAEFGVIYLLALEAMRQFTCAQRDCTRISQTFFLSHRAGTYSHGSDNYCQAVDINFIETAIINDRAWGIFFEHVYVRDFCVICFGASINSKDHMIDHSEISCWYFQIRLWVVAADYAKRARVSIADLIRYKNNKLWEKKFT